jgi:hypothetical protein
MAAYYGAMRTVIERHGGRLEKLVGDGVLAVFGAPTSLEDDALRAVRCAAAMLDELTRVSDDLCRMWGVRLAMRAGVHTGELVVAAGAELVGDTMNTAARLEQAAGPNEVLIGEATWRLVRHDVQVEPVRTPTLRGKASAVRTWRLLSPTPDAHVGSAIDLRSPMVGRDQAMDRLTSALDKAEADGGTHLAVIVGSPGVGKTRLLRAFAAQVAGRAAVISARCEESNESLGCLSSVEILNEVLSTDGVKLPLAQTGADAPDESASQAPPLGLPERSPNALANFRQALARTAGEQPIVIVLDDLHQASPPELESLERLTNEPGDRAVLVVAAARPRLRERYRALTRPGGVVRDVVELPSLHADEIRVLLSNLLSPHALPDDLLDRIAQASEGNPLFLTETVRMLVDDGFLVREDGVWVAVAGTELLPVSPTIHQLVGARLERLHPEERLVLERASVIGRQFDRSALAHLLGSGMDDRLEPCLANLRRFEMIEPAGGSLDEIYRFCADVMREAAYGLLLMETRADLHERYAAWILAHGIPDGPARDAVAESHRVRAQGYRRQLSPGPGG